MRLSEGQRLALRQLKRIADAPLAALRIDHVEDKDTEADVLQVDVSIDCTHYGQADGGLALHDRESLRIWIDPDFPWSLSLPRVRTSHSRFHGFRHVQWGNYLCLYQSSESQWDPSRGMVGFIDQLHDWLKKAAANELDAEEGPLHPPVAYAVSKTTAYIQTNTPGRDVWPWVGAALYEEVKPGLISITDWRQVGEIDRATVFAPALLLDFELSFEYPRFVQTLLRWLKVKGIETPRVMAHLMIAAERVPDGQPLRIVIGAPSRGIVGKDQNRQQHLSVWEVSAEDTGKLKRTALACGVLGHYKDSDTPEAIRELVAPIFDDFFKWQAESRVGWCRVVENRPEIVVRRDKDSNMELFNNKRVVVWGCGALGGQVAEHLVRAGVGKLILVDYDRVDPGVLVRQNFVHEDLNDSKVEALKRRLLAINPKVLIESRPSNILTSVLDEHGWDDDTDLVIDATASLRVRTKLEHVLKGRVRRAPIASMMLSGAARHGMLTFSPVGYSGGPFDVIRRLGLAAKNRDWLVGWVEAFWRRETAEPTRQPEPGCSDPTFVGSNADVAALAARMLNGLAKRLHQEGSDALGMLLSQDATEKKDEVFNFAPDIIISDGSVEYRLSQDAWRDTKAWIASAVRERTAEDETGGLMFGQYDESLRIGWVTGVSGPPRDSTFSAEGFVCGIEGTAELCEEQKSRSLDAVQYVGTWHSHPVSEARPSHTDFAGIGTLFANNLEQGPYQLMMIVGFAAQANTEIGLYGFEKHELANFDKWAELRFSVQGSTIDAPALPPYRHRIGLSLSGGGSRAVAFHLGTLRALEDTGLLNDIDLISGVSGGSVMTGLLAYTDAPFDEVDQKTVAFLKAGLVVPALKKLCHPKRLLVTLLHWLMVTWPSVLLDLVVVPVKKVTGLLGIGAISERVLKHVRWPLRRRYSRTHVMADAIADAVSDAHCNAPTRDGKTIVFNACELRTGTAFRMSNTRYGSWRFGWAPAAELRIADAIAASAAFPALLPAFDWVKTFTKNDIQKRARVLITDGGVYENIGVSVMEPGAHPDFNVIDYQPEVLIASDAGTGQFTGEAMPGYWAGRMIQVVETVMRKVQDATKSRLHAHARDGHIRAFVYAHLGQIDNKVPMRPSAWISREAVMDYPTDFSAMTDQNLNALSGRGEVITRTLLTRYLLSD